ncbi:MAG: serine hydrolase [Candidatus Eisenbacteria bacterium]|nr:serine hydrolase [Candidatus Latescibacterota bacterium]MBD3301585.1 serine hydrolase [Candidatus Eisenbacteria bacterium]
MTPRRCTKLSTMLLAAILAGPPATHAGATDEAVRRVAETMARLEKLGFHGTLLIAGQEETLLAEGYGLADRQADRPVTPETVFTIGSITKQFTAAAILKLEMQGKLSTDDPIARWFEDVPTDKETITLHHLLTHTAGFPGALGDDYDLEATREAFLAEAMACDLIHPPGVRYEYSNVGYSLLGIVVELASGIGYEDFLRRNLFLPAGMTKTGYLLPAFEADELAVGYRDGERWGTVLERPMLSDGPSWHLRANGGIHSNSLDMLRWHRALEGEEVLSSKAKEKYFRPYVDEGGGDSFYAYGWAVFTTPRGTKLLAHNGGNRVFAADCLRYVDEGIFLFIASNGEMSAIQVSERIAPILFGASTPLPPDVVETSPDLLADYEGTYRLPSGGSIEVASVPGRLVLAAGDDATVPLLSGSALSEVEDRTLRERTGSITRAWLEGDVRPIFEAFGGRIPLEELAEQAGSIRSRWEEALGPVLDVEPLPSAGEPDGARSFAEIRMEKGTRYVIYEWDGSRLAGIGLERRRPPEAEGRREVFPISTTRFESFRIAGGPRVRVRFESDALVLEREDGEVSATRSR